MTQISYIMSQSPVINALTECLIRAKFIIDEGFREMGIGLA
jgi:hypothetical protein